MSQTPPECAPTKQYTPDEAHLRLARLVGDWRGIARTWMDPSKPPLEARWEGRIAPVLDGRFVRFTYGSELQGTPFAGELLIAYESTEGLWRLSWVDSFHTGTAIIVSVGEGGPAAQPVKAQGKYFAAPGHPHWGWRTELHDADAAQLTVRMFNITPEGQEDLGVELVLKRG